MGAVAMLEDEEVKANPGLTKEEIIALAKGHIGDYFKNKPFHCGGTIPSHLLFAKKRVNLVLDCTFDMAMDIADEALDSELTADDDEYIAAGGVCQDIRSVIDVLHDMAAHKVPQEFSNGMLVLYLELCMGANVVYA